MAQQQSITAELLQKINLTKLRPTPAYLSIHDGMSVVEFANSPYSQKYTVDTKNIYWGQTLNDSHVFDEYSVFTSHHSSVKVRLDMLSFVAHNAERYKMGWLHLLQDAWYSSRQMGKQNDLLGK